MERTLANLLARTRDFLTALASAAIGGAWLSILPPVLDMRFGRAIPRAEIVCASPPSPAIFILDQLGRPTANGWRGRTASRRVIQAMIGRTFASAERTARTRARSLIDRKCGSARRMAIRKITGVDRTWWLGRAMG